MNQELRTLLESELQKRISDETEALKLKCEMQKLADTYAEKAHQTSLAWYLKRGETNHIRGLLSEPFTCFVCKCKPAAVHFTEIKGVEIKKLDLCEECAEKKGVHKKEGFSLSDLLLGLGDLDKKKSA